MNILRSGLQRVANLARVIFRIPLSMLSSPQRRLRMSLPIRIALFVFVVLSAVAITTISLKVGIPNLKDFVVSNGRNSAIVVCAFVVIPLLAGKLVSLWLKDVTVHFPEIQAAWNFGIRALQEKGMSITSVPLYLVVGPKNATEARNLMETSELHFRVEGQPEGDPPLLWYVSRDAIFLVCPGASQAALLSNTIVTKSGVIDIPEPEEDFDQTMDDGATDWLNATVDFEAEESGFGNLLFDDQKDLYDISMSGREFSTNSSLKLMLDSLNLQPQTQIDKEALSTASAKLTCVCALLRRYRQPECAINGIISYLPHRLLAASENCVSALQSAVQLDNRVISHTIGMRAHTVVMVGGMECESGFIELMKRFGPDVSRRNRIGKGLPNKWCPPSPDTLESVARLACGAFEDNIYPLFRKDHGELKEAGNTKLYRLLCVIRLRVAERLSMVMRKSYSYPEGQEHVAMPLLGCYFSGTGERPDQQAFSASVFRKLMQDPQEVDWHPNVRKADETYCLLRDLVLVSNLVVVVLIVVAIWSSMT